MDAYMTRDSCEYYMFTNSNKAFINFNRQERESEQIMNLLLSEEATNFKARSIALVSAPKIELADGNRAE